MSTSSLRNFGLFLLRCTIVGLAVACVIIIARPDVLGSKPAAGQQRNSYADAVAASARSVVNIYTSRVTAQQGGPGQTATYSEQTNLGSGVIIDSAGFIVTNYHVIAGANAVSVQLADGRIASPRLVGTDADTDLALLQIDAGDLQAISLGRSDQMQIGDVVLAIGNPYGLSQTVTQGIISATGRGLLGLTTFENYIQTDAAINSGNSGGALINTRGELIGINTAVISREVNIQGISFAIPVNLVSGVVRALREDGRVLRGWLGLDMQQLTSEGWRQLGLPEDTGILLRAVQHQGPAWQAGIRPGDVLVSINGERVLTNQQALLTVAGYKPGTPLNIVYWRDGQMRETQAVAGDRARETAAPPQETPAAAS
ncbi:MAG: trypsin-like peptidase domain-containing protein [Pseudomonadota bacterium]